MKGFKIVHVLSSEGKSIRQFKSKRRNAYIVKFMIEVTKRTGKSLVCRYNNKDQFQTDRDGFHYRSKEGVAKTRSLGQEYQRVIALINEIERQAQEDEAEERASAERGARTEASKQAQGSQGSIYSAVLYYKLKDRLK